MADDAFAVRIDYTNWRGERGERLIVPNSFAWGSNRWHPEHQWLLEAWNVEKRDWRTFALKSIHSWAPAHQEGCAPGRAERAAELEAEVAKLRAIAVAAVNATDGCAADGVSTEFLSHLPREVAALKRQRDDARRERDRAGEKAKAALDQRDALLAAAKAVLPLILREGNIVGHGHRVPGVWDVSNGPPKGGQPCQECAVAQALERAVREASQP